MGLAVGLNLNFECSSTALLGSKLTQKYLPESGNRTRNRKRCRRRIRQTPQTTSTTNGSPATIQLLSIAHTAAIRMQNAAHYSCCTRQLLGIHQWQQVLLVGKKEGYLCLLMTGLKGCRFLLNPTVGITRLLIFFFSFPSLK